MSTFPTTEPPPAAVTEALARLELAGLAVVLAWRPAFGGSWSTAFANPLLPPDEWESEMVDCMRAKVGAELLKRKP